MNSFFQIARQRGYEFGASHLTIPESDVDEILDQYGNQLTYTANLLSRPVTIRWGSQPHQQLEIAPLELDPTPERSIPPTSTTDMNQPNPTQTPLEAQIEAIQNAQANKRILIFAEQRLGAELWEIIRQMLDPNESEMPGLVHIPFDGGANLEEAIANSKQVVLTSSSDNLKIGDSIEDCLQWRRRDYHFAADLEAAASQMKHRGSTESWVETSARTLDPDLRCRHPGDPGRWDWIEVVSRSRFIVTPIGLYQRCDVLDFAPCTVPDSLVSA